eukprot:2273516-Rhodomonas_salina.1
MLPTMYENAIPASSSTSIVNSASYVFFGWMSPNPTCAQWRRVSENGGGARVRGNNGGVRGNNGGVRAVIMAGCWSSEAKGGGRWRRSVGR